MAKVLQFQLQHQFFQWISSVQFSHLVMSNSLQPHGLWPDRLLSQWDFSGKNTIVGFYFLLQGIQPIQRYNQHLLHQRQILYHWATWEALLFCISVRWYCSLKGLQLFYVFGALQVIHLQGSEGARNGKANLNDKPGKRCKGTIPRRGEIWERWSGVCREQWVLRWAEAGGFIRVLARTENKHKLRLLWKLG